MAEDLEFLRIPAQEIPVPQTISPEARSFLRSATRRLAESASDASSVDLAESAELALQMLRPRAGGFRGAIEDIDIGNGALLYRVTPDVRFGRRSQVAYFDVHGGGFVTGGGEMCRILAQLRAMELGVEVWSCDYRLAPAHPFPAALDDVMAAYRHVLMHVPARDVVVAGSSAGGNLAAAMLLLARSEQLPMPAALVLLTPGLDMTGAGDSRVTNRFLDVNLPDGGGTGPASYVGESDPTHPWLSPLYGEYDADWPPTLLASGTRDLLLSDTVRMHRILRRAGVWAELHVTEAGPHGGFMGTAPEDRELMDECRRFCEAAWKID